MAQSMTIELVRIGGMLVGRRFQDRWNLETLGLTALEYTRNGAALKRARRTHAEFTFSLKQGEYVEMTPSDRAMFGPSSVYSQVA